MSSWIDAIFTKRTPSPSGSMPGVRGPSAPGEPMRAKLTAEAVGTFAPVFAGVAVCRGIAAEGCCEPGDPECS